MSVVLLLVDEDESPEGQCFKGDSEGKTAKSRTFDAVYGLLMAKAHRTEHRTCFLLSPEVLLRRHQIHQRLLKEASDVGEGASV